MNRPPEWADGPVYPVGGPVLCIAPRAPAAGFAAFFSALLFAASSEAGRSPGRGAAMEAVGDAPAQEREEPRGSAGRYEGVSSPATETGSSAEKLQRPLTFVWEAGDGPIRREAFLAAVEIRLPPGRFVRDEARSRSAWVVLVRKVEPGQYQVEVAPPGRKALARRVPVHDPEDGRRRLALLAAHALEHGTFPPVDTASGERDVAPTLSRVIEEGVAASDAGGPPPQDRPPQRPKPARPVQATGRPTGATDPALRSSPGGLRSRGHGISWGFTVGAAVTLPSRSATGAVFAPGGGVTADVGVLLARIAWLGAVGHVTRHPVQEVDVVRGAAGAFAGLRPSWGRLRLGLRLSAEGGAVRGRAAGESARRPFAAGALSLWLGVAFPGRSGMGVALGSEVRVTSRASTFETPRVRTGLGRWRGSVFLGIYWQAPGGGGKIRRAAGRGT